MAKKKKKTCSTCGGEKEVQVTTTCVDADGKTVDVTHYESCDTCGGTGEVDDD